MRVKEMLEDREASQNAEDSPRVGEPHCRCARLSGTGPKHRERLQSATRSGFSFNCEKTSSMSLKVFVASQQL
jgi:hypothetical protein